MGWLPAMILTLVVSMAVFGLRGIYFAPIHESGVPLEITGVAVGVISMIGLSPDIFMPLLGALLLDTYSGARAISTSFYLSVACAASGLSPRFC